MRRRGGARSWKLGSLGLLLFGLLLIVQVVWADDTEEVQQTRFAAEGRYAVVATGEGMLDHSDGTGFTLNVPGTTVVAAYLYWSGTAAPDLADDTVALARDGAVVLPTVVPEPGNGTYGPKLWYDGFYYWLFVADVTDAVQVGSHEYAVLDFDETDLMRRRDGAGLMVVYEDPSQPVTRVEIKDELDRFYRGWGEGPRGESAVSCFQFAAADEPRDLEFWMFLGEINNETNLDPPVFRPNALWYLTGGPADPMPTDMVNAPTGGPTTGIQFTNHPGPYPFNSSDDRQWDTYGEGQEPHTIPVPAGDVWACFQVESAVDPAHPEWQPASGMWAATSMTIRPKAPVYGTIGDTVWCDANYNNLYDAGEGRAGVTVSLYSDVGCDGTGDTLIAPQDTVGDGQYLFTGLEVGVPGQPVCYVVRVDKADMGTCNNPITPEEYDVPLDTGHPVDLDNDFGFNQFAGLGDYVWYDAKKDGIQQIGEPGIGGVKVNLYDCNNNLLASTTTSATGFYSFVGLRTGSYSLGFVLPEGHGFTLQNQGADPAVDSDADPSTGRTVCTTLTAAEFDPTWDAGIYRPTPPPPPPVVPEASTLLLMGSAATGLAAYVGLQLRARRRR